MNAKRKKTKHSKPRSAQQLRERQTDRKNGVRPRWRPWAAVVTVIGLIGSVLGIIQYVTGPSHDERFRRELLRDLGAYDEENHADLISQYPGGYVLWKRGHASYIPATLSREMRRCKVDAEEMGAVTLTADRVTFHLPLVTDTRTGSSDDSLVVGLERKEGAKLEMSLLGACNVVVRVLKLTGDDVIGVIGFR